MKAIARIFSYEIRRQARRRGYLFISIGVPLIALALFFGWRAIDQSQTSKSQGDNAPHIPVNVGLPGNNLAAEVRAAGVVNLSPLVLDKGSGSLIFFDNEADAQAALKQGKIGFYFVIPADYQAKGEAQMYLERLSLIDSTSYTNALKNLLVNALVAQSSKPLKPETVTQLQTKLNFTPHSVDATGANKQSAGDASFGLVYIFALALLFSAFTTSGYLMQSVVEEKESRMIEVILSSVRPAQLLTGKILALGLLGIIQMTLWTGTILIILRVLSQGLLGLTAIPGLEVSPTQLVLLVVYFLLGYMLFASTYAAIGAIVNSMREGPQIAGFVTLPFAVPLWATAVFATAPNGPVAVVLSLIPFTSPLAMVMRISITTVPVEQLIVSVILLLLLVAFTMWLAGRLFRVNALLSGQMPRLRDLVRLVRESA